MSERLEQAWELVEHDAQDMAAMRVDANIILPASRAAVEAAAREPLQEALRLVLKSVAEEEYLTDTTGGVRYVMRQVKDGRKVVQPDEILARLRALLPEETSGE